MRTFDPFEPGLDGAAVLDALPIVAYRTDREGKPTYVSHGWKEFTGSDGRDVIEHASRALIHPGDRAHSSARWAEARENGAAYRAEFRVRTADGAYRWVLSKADPIRTDDGIVTGWFGTITDIDDLKHAQAALAESEATYRAFSDTIPGVTWAASPAGELTFVGDGWTALHGKPRAGALGESWLESVYPGDVQRVLEVWGRSLATGDPYDVQFRLRVSDGSYRWFLVRALPVRDASGAIARWVGVNVDIDDQRRADEEREQFVRLVEASDDFIAIGDEHGKATYVNEAGRRMLDIGSIERARATHMMDYFMPEDRAFVESEILPKIARGGGWLGELRLRNFRTGQPVPFSYNVFALVNEDGTNVGVATLSRDLRGRYRVEAGLRALAETGAAMFRSLDFDQTVRDAAQAATRSFATTCIVDMLDAGDGIRRVAIAHRSAAIAATGAAVPGGLGADHPIVRALRAGAATLVAELPANWPAWCGIDALGLDLDARSMVCAPIASGGGADIIGALTCIVDRRDARGGYVDDDLRFAEELAGRIGLALEHVRAYEHERRIAVTLQEASLPGVLPSVDGVRLSADYRPGNSEATIGGDWYDAFVLDDGRLAITIGDVLGNGLGAAVTMGKLRQVMQSVGLLLPDPNTMLAAADRTIRALSADTYATALAGIYDPADRTFTFASAGHPGPLRRHPDGRNEECPAPGTMLGLRAAGEHGSTTISLAAGATLVFYTDGLIEATRDSDEGYRRIRAALGDATVLAARNPAHALVEHVLRHEPATDDLAVLVAEFGPRLRSAAQPWTWRWPANLDQIRTARLAVRARLRAAGESENALSLTELALGELVGNAIEHGRGEFVDVALRIGAQAATLAITNDGAPFERPAVELAGMGFAEHGRGLALLQAFGCEVEVAQPAPGRCTVTATIPRRF